MGDALQIRALRQRNRFGDAVSRLPVKVVMRNVEQRFFAAIRKVSGVAERLASQVHVRHEGQNLDIGGSCLRSRFHPVIVGVRRDHQPAMVRRLLRDDDLLNFLIRFRKDET